MLACDLDQEAGSDIHSFSHSLLSAHYVASPLSDAQNIPVNNRDKSLALTARAFGALFLRAAGSLVLTSDLTLPLAQPLHMEMLYRSAVSSFGSVILWLTP